MNRERVVVGTIMAVLMIALVGLSIAYGRLPRADQTQCESRTIPHATVASLCDRVDSCHRRQGRSMSEEARVACENIVLARDPMVDAFVFDCTKLDDCQFVRCVKIHSELFDIVGQLGDGKQ